jgi:chromosome segregation ATPase
MHSRLQVLRGQLESARKRVQEVEAEVRDRNIEPDKLAETIELLEAKGREELETIEQELEQAEERLKPFLQED